MARTNTIAKSVREVTHEGAPAARINNEQALRRSVMACMLWEDGFYEDGEEIAARIYRLALTLKPQKISQLAIEARTLGNLRHVPLMLLSALAKVGKGERLVQVTIEAVIQRADELAEFLAIHAKVNKVSPNAMKKTISAQMKKGLARAFQKFNEYQLAKYDRAGAIRLRDVLFMVHAKPKDAEQAAMWKRLVAGELATPDTWEVQLSAGKDKGDTFTRLLTEEKLGYFALLRNLRNMEQSNVNPELVKSAIIARKNGADRILPFRYIAAARAAKQFEPALDEALTAAISDMPILPGKTLILVDVSHSMNVVLSGKSDMTRMDAAAALAAIWPGDVRLFTFSDRLVEVPPRRGMAGVDAIINSQSHGSTQLGGALNGLAKIPYDRIIVVTDEQSHDRVPAPARGADGVMRKGYMINVAPYKNGVGYGNWHHIDGFSEGILKYIYAVEQPEETAIVGEENDTDDDPLNSTEV